MKSCREIGQEPITKFFSGTAAHKASRILEVSYMYLEYLPVWVARWSFRSFVLYFDSSRRVTLPYLW